jgi:hypothetical protein
MIKTIKYLFGSAIVALAFSGCDRQLDVNVSPNNLTSAPIQTVLTNVTTNVGFTAGSDMHRFTSIWAQQFAGQGAAGTQTLEYERYNIQSTDVNNLWSSVYATILMDCEYIINNSEGSPWYSGIAKICKAWTFGQAVDMWGDIPFTEALKGVAGRMPMYDKGESIYPELIKLLDEGIAELNQATSALAPGTNETIYQGNRQRWRKMANTYKMRLYLHLSEVNPSAAKSGIESVLNAELIASNTENFSMRFVNAANAQNPIDQFEVRRQDQFFPHSFLVNLMNGKSDPRRASYFTPFPYTSSPATYKGATPGEPQSFAYSRMHTYLRGAQLRAPVPTSNGSVPSSGNNAPLYDGIGPIRMLTFAEYNFIRAEAALRLGVAGNAESFYRAGITASMQDAGVAQADIDTYLAAQGTLNGTASENLKKIIEEKYVANYGVALEPYNDWRRTGYPQLTPSPTSIIGANIPTIFYYPQSEINSNTNAKQKGSLLEKVFWDK